MPTPEAAPKDPPKSPDGPASEARAPSSGHPRVATALIVVSSILAFLGIFSVWINRRGEVELLLHQSSSLRVRTCIELVAQPTRTFSREVESAALTVRLPSESSQGEIVCKVPVRAPLE